MLVQMWRVKPMSRPLAQWNSDAFRSKSLGQTIVSFHPEKYRIIDRRTIDALTKISIETTTVTTSTTTSSTNYRAYVSVSLVFFCNAMSHNVVSAYRSFITVTSACRSFTISPSKDNELTNHKLMKYTCHDVTWLLSTTHGYDTRNATKMIHMILAANF